MASNKAVSAARKSSIVWLLLAGLVLIGGLALTILYIGPKYIGMLGAPKVLSSSDVTDAQGLPIYNVQVAGEEIIDDLYYYEYTVNGIRTSMEYFGALWLGKRFLLVRQFGEIDTSVLTYTGTLRELESDERSEVYAGLLAEVPADQQELLLPIILDATDSPTKFENLALAALALGTVGFGLYGVYRGITHLANPNKHPFLKSLARLGDVDDVVDRIEKERVLGEEKIGRLTLTRSWVIDEKGNNFRAMRAEDIIWIYKHAQRSRYGTNYSVRIYDGHGEKLFVGAKNQDQADEMGMAIAKKAPWALLGFDKAIEDAYNKNRGELIAAVEKRKRQPAQS
ncbi:MAG: hypothetical protein H6670_04525 [Anaerolineaceae bacterium]|nr:hypothetical protein [Anaerolineae bacterium]MCB9458890.1 hypothetical protein [Anaerolineaceae bacterium]